MATTTIVNGNVYVTALVDKSGNLTPSNAGVSGNTITHDSNKAVEIYSARIEYGYVNEIGGIIFKSRGNTDTNVPNRIRDMKKIKKIVTVTGVLDDETSLRGITKRQNLLNMGEFDRALTLVWGTGNYRTIFDASVNVDKNNLDATTHGVFILKMKFKETAGIYGVPVASDPQPFTKHGVEIQFINGKDI